MDLFEEIQINSEYKTFFFFFCQQSVILLLILQSTGWCKTERVQRGKMRQREREGERDWPKKYNYRIIHVGNVLRLRLIKRDPWGLKFQK